MKPTKEQIRKLGYKLCKSKTTDKNCEYCWFYNAPRTCHNTLRHYIAEVKLVITEWEKIRSEK